MAFVRKRLGTIALLGLMAAMLVVVVRTALAGPPTTPRPIDAERAARDVAPPATDTSLRVERPEGEWIGALGLVEPRAPESRLTTAVAGRIARILVREGERVTAGAVLVELESGPEEAVIARAEAEVEVARASLLRSRRGLRPEDLQAVQAEAEAARVRALASEEALGRLEAAAAGGGATRDEVERARRAAEAEREGVAAASARARAGRSGRREDALVAGAELQAAEARLAEARAALARLRIVAPIDGEILEIHYRVGEYVQPGGGSEPLVVMGDTSTLRVRADVDERDIGRVAVGAAALVTADAFPDRRVSARVVEVGRRMGRKNVRTDEPTERVDVKVLEVVLELEAPEGLLPGLRVMTYLTPTAP